MEGSHELLLPASCSYTLTYQTLLFCRVPINPILRFILRSYKKVGFGRLGYLYIYISSKAEREERETERRGETGRERQKERERERGREAEREREREREGDYAFIAM